MKTLPLNKGAVCWVDDDDYERYCHFKWRLVAGDRYAGRWEQKNGQRTLFYLHRLIAGAVPGDDVHHDDENKLNNVKSNLKVTVRDSHLRHHMVSGGPRSEGYKGVHYWRDGWKPRNKRWFAVIKIDSKHRTIGYFHTAEEAAEAYDREAYRQWGQDAYLNFPDRIPR